MSILLVSNNHHYTVQHIYDGYAKAFQNQCGNNAVCTDINTLIDSLPRKDGEMNAWGLIIAQALITDNKHSHVVFISGLNVPNFVYETLHEHGKKVYVIACDDPHSNAYLLERNKWIDRYLTNEKTMVGIDDNISYLPSATISQVVDKSKVPDDLRSDICFVGTVYPNRVPVLEKTLEFAQMNGLDCKIVGPLGYVPESSPIRIYAKEAIVDNGTMKALCAGSKLCLNIERDVKWNSLTNTQNNTMMCETGKEPYSLDPRAYEVASCGTPQLFVGNRKEAKVLFEDSAMYSDFDNVEESLVEFFGKSEEEQKKMALNAQNVVLREHTYDHRVMQIINLMKED